MMVGLFSGINTRLGALADRGGARVMVFLTLFSLLMMTPGFFTTPPVDRDEARFSQASKQMINTGDFIDIRLGEGTRYKKPAGIYWLQSLSAAIAGPGLRDQIWVYRVPSLIGAVAAVLLTYLIALSLIGARGAFGAGVLMAVSFLLGAEAHLAKTDATMLAFILAAQLGLLRVYQGARLSNPGLLLFWGSLAATILLKGPVGLLVVGGTIVGLLALTRRAKWLADLRVLPGLIILLGLVLPWYIAISYVAGHAFWDEALGRDLVAKIGSGQENHGAPPGTYLLMFWITFLPGSVIFALGLPEIWAARRGEVMIFAAAWIVPTWLAFEFVATKLIHYVLPTYPALAILAAAGFLAAPHVAGRPFRSAIQLLMLLLPFGIVAGIGAFVLALDGAFRPTAIGLALLMIGTVIYWASLRANLRMVALAALGILSLGLSHGFYGALGNTPHLWPAPRIAAAMQAYDGCENPQFAAVGYHEPSLMFLVGRDLQLTDHNGAAALLAAGCAVVVGPVDQPFAGPVVPLLELKGLNIGSGRDVALAVVATP